MHIKEAVFRILDTETTGLDTATAAVCELGMVDVSYSDVAGIETWFPGAPQSWLCNPGVPIPAEAKAVHHILDADVDQHPHVKFRIEDELMRGAQVAAPVFVAHHAKYDREILEREGFERGRKWLCTWRLAMHVWPDAPSYKNEVLRYWLGFDHLPYPTRFGPHRAGHDVIVTALVLAKALQTLVTHSSLLGSTDVDELIRWSESPVLLKGLMGFGKHHDKKWADVAQIDLGYLQWIARCPEQDWDMDKHYTARHYTGKLL